MAQASVMSLEETAAMERNPKNARLISHNLKQAVGYDFLISDPKPAIFSGPDNDVRERLGQVETPAWVAELMARLCIKGGNEKLLDPCFGTGSFLTAAYSRLLELSGKRPAKILEHIYGVELDPFSFAKGIVALQAKSMHSKIPHNYFLGDVFDFQGKGFDAVVMNPPYIRQEMLSKSNGKIFNKSTISKKLLENTGGSILSARSNLYAYFIVQASKFLLEGGRLAAIIPKVWLDSKYGESLQKFLLEGFDIDFIIDFDTDTFSDVIVEDCILVLRKGPSNSSATRFVHIKRKEDPKSLENMLNEKPNDFENQSIRIVTVARNLLSNDHKWGKFLHAPSDVITMLLRDDFVRLGDVATVDRGTTTSWNEFFMLDDKKAKALNIGKEHLVEILATPKELRGYSTAQVSTHMLMLSISGPLKTTNGASQYIESARNLQAPLTMRRLMSADPEGWYRHTKPKSGPIIFSYIIRMMKNFVMNTSSYAIRDNFYIITPVKGNPFLLFGILNSSLVRLCLELSGRRYGNGLLKIQAYELADMGIPDFRNMGKRQRERLADLGTELSKCSFDDANAEMLIKKIDDIIYDHLGLKIDGKKINDAEKDLMNKRLGRVR